MSAAIRTVLGPVRCLLVCVCVPTAGCPADSGCKRLSVGKRIRPDGPKSGQAQLVRGFHADHSHGLWYGPHFGSVCHATPLVVRCAIRIACNVCCGSVTCTRQCCVNRMFVTVSVVDRVGAFNWLLAVLFSSVVCYVGSNALSIHKCTRQQSKLC